MAESAVVHHVDKDRITLSMRRVYNVAQYESVEISLGLAADRGAAETMKEAFERVESELMTEFNGLCKKIEGAHPTKSKGGFSK